VIYTSGSSGVPKGAPNSHAGVRNTLTELSSVLGLSAEDRMLAISSLNYDMSVYEILGTLLAGACVVVPDQGEASDPDRLGALLTNAGVTCWSSAPALLEMLLDHIQDPRPAGWPVCCLASGCTTWPERPRCRTARPAIRCVSRNRCPAISRGAARYLISVCTYSMTRVSRCPWERAASCSSAARVWDAATGAALG
jgi:acyl-CoA synthetase (AMP-forming)/AMP-acid ligase II